MANEIEKLKIELLDPELAALADKIVQVIEEGKQALAVSINEIIKTTYWRIGQYIVEFEQQGNAKAKYGTSLLSNLAKLLRARVGRGYSRPNLNNMRKFYLMYPICQTSDKSGHPNLQTNGICQTSDKLTWSHICELVTIDDQLEREFYEKECISAWVETCGSNFRLTSRGCSLHPQELQHTTPLTHREGTGEGLPGETPG